MRLGARFLASHKDFHCPQSFWASGCTAGLVGFCISADRRSRRPIRANPTEQFAPSVPACENCTISSRCTLLIPARSFTMPTLCGYGLAKFALKVLWFSWQVLQDKPLLLSWCHSTIPRLPWPARYGCLRQIGSGRAQNQCINIETVHFSLADSSSHMGLASHRDSCPPRSLLRQKQTQHAQQRLSIFLDSFILHPFV